LDRLKDKSFLYDVLKLVGGTSIAQVLSVLFAPMLSRLFSPEAFGILQLFMSTVILFGVIACLRYDNAIMLPKETKEAVNLLGVAIIFCVLFSIVIAIVLLFWGSEILAIFHAEELSPYCWLIPLVIFFTGILNALNYWNSRTRHYGRLSTARITNYGSMLSYQTITGFYRSATSGNLVLGYSIGTVFSTLVLGFQTVRDDFNTFIGFINWSDMWQVLKDYKKFPSVDLWSTLLNNLSWQLPVYLLAFYFDESVVGYYSLSYRVMSLPIMLVGTSIGQVFFQRTSELHAQNKEIKPIVLNVVSQLVALGLMAAILMFLVREDVFILIFGSKWAEAGIYVQILSPWFIILFIASPLSSLFSVFQKQEQLLVLNIFIFLTRFGSLYIGGVNQNVRLGLFLFSITGILTYGYLIIWAMKKAEISVTSIFQVFGRYLIYAALPTLIIVVVKYIIHGSIWWILLTSGFSAILYYLMIAKREGVYYF